jgi:hypothetical protein
MMAQITTATVDQYLTQVGEYASTTSQSFRESCSVEAEALATADASSNIYTNAVNALSASISESTRDTAAAPLNVAANATRGDVEARGGQATKLHSMPETGGPGATTLSWGVIAILSLPPCPSIARTAVTGARDRG